MKEIIENALAEGWKMEVFGRSVFLLIPLYIAGFGLISKELHAKTKVMIVMLLTLTGYGIHYTFTKGAENSKKDADFLVAYIQNNTANTKLGSYLPNIHQYKIILQTKDGQKEFYQSELKSVELALKTENINFPWKPNGI
jgi:hypothetical protein